MIAFSTPASADTFNENFDDQSYDLSVQLGSGARWCNTYSGQYGTTGPSLCLFSTTEPTVFTFPSGVQVQGFQFVAGAKNGSTQLTVSYSDGTTAAGTIDGSCCETTVAFAASEGKAITGFSVPADWDLWLFDSLGWWGPSSAPTTTTTEPPQTTSTVGQTSSTTSTSTSSSTVPTTMPPPPPDTQPTVETTSPETSLPETTVPTTLPAVVTTIANTTTVPPTTTTQPAPTTTSPPDAPGSTESVVNPDPVVDTGVIEQPPSDAPIEQRLEFESKVDIFSGQYDNYVPVGSKISVAQRRTIVATTAVFIMFAPPPSRMRRK